MVDISVKTIKRRNIVEKWMRKLFKKTIIFIEQKSVENAFQSIVDDMKARPYMRKCRRRVIRVYKCNLSELSC